MNENELVGALDKLRIEAVKNEQMSSADAFKNLQLAIGYAEQLAARMKVPLIRELVEGVISIQKTHSTISTCNNWDIVFFCGSIQLQWKNDCDGVKFGHQPR